MSEQDKNTNANEQPETVAEAADQAQPQASTMPPPAGQVAVNQESKNLAILIWLGSLLFSFIPGFIVLLVKNDDPWLREQAKENVNFCISYLLYFIGATMLAVILIGGLIFLFLMLGYVVFTLIATVKASEGGQYQVPYIFRVLK